MVTLPYTHVPQEEELIPLFRAYYFDSEQIQTWKIASVRLLYMATKVEQLFQNDLYVTGQTPLHVAAETTNDAVLLLLKFNAKVCRSKSWQQIYVNTRIYVMATCIFPLI